MEIATGQSSCFQCLEVDDEIDGFAISGLRLSNPLMNLTTAKVEECNGKDLLRRVLRL